MLGRYKLFDLAMKYHNETVVVVKKRFLGHHQKSKKSSPQITTDRNKF